MARWKVEPSVRAHGSISTKLQAASSGPGQLSLLFSCSVGSCCRTFTGTTQGNSHLTSVSSFLLFPEASTSHFSWKAPLLSSIGLGFSRSLMMPALGPMCHCLLPLSGPGELVSFHPVFSGAQCLHCPVLWVCDLRRGILNLLCSQRKGLGKGTNEGSNICLLCCSGAC